MKSYTLWLRNTCLALGVQYLEEMLIMANSKTKFEKHTNDNEKRRKSIREKEKAKLNQSLIIKRALSNDALHDNSYKKIIFNDEEDINSGKINVSKNYLNGNGKSLLFDNSESEGEDIEIREKIQFSGEKGFQCLKLQSTYGNDERFKIDERFIEDGKEEFYQYKNETPSSEGVIGEKYKQLKILETVLGSPIIKPDQGKKLKRTYEMVRYDASNKDHEIYENSAQSKTLNSLSLSKKRKERNKMPKTDKEELIKPIVSKEKFYEVSNEIKNCFKDRKQGNSQFSILQTYGLNDEYMIKHEKDEVLEKDLVNADVEKTINYKTSKRRDEEDADKIKMKERSVTAKGIWKESFFFIQEDPRIKEGLEFINKKDSVEASEAAENYDQMRRKLKEILRLHLKKQLRKKDPFKNKIGGMNKKQLTNTKFKHSKKIFNKKKPYKVPSDKLLDLLCNDNLLLDL